MRIEDQPVETAGRSLSQVMHGLLEIVHSLESADAPDARVIRVLELLDELVRHDLCAVFVEAAAPILGADLVAVPEPRPEDTAALRRRMVDLYQLMAGEEGRAPDSHAPGHRLALPVVGAEETIGVILIERASSPFAEDDLRLLGIVAGLLGSYITTLRLRDEEAARRRDLELADEYHKLLVGMVSHDVRNPIASIMLRAQAMMRRTSDPTVVSGLQRIVANSEVANRIIRDLLDMTRARARGMIPIDRQPGDLCAIVRQGVEEARVRHPDRSIVLRQECGDAIGGWDADRIGQVIGNLLNNALEYGDPASDVTVSLAGDGRDAILTVHNAGPPISPEILPSLFDPFRRASRRGRHKGLGLGLYIVDQIVRAHGGTVEARSRAEEGTTFTVKLPIGSGDGGASISGGAA